MALIPGAQMCLHGCISKYTTIHIHEFRMIESPRLWSHEILLYLAVFDTAVGTKNDVKLGPGQREPHPPIKCQPRHNRGVHGGDENYNQVSQLQHVEFLQAGPVTGEIFGHNCRLRSKCLQVQPVTCWHPLVSFYWIGVYFVISSKMIGDFPAVLNFSWLFLKLNRCICNSLSVLPDLRAGILFNSPNVKNKDGIRYIHQLRE